MMTTKADKHVIYIYLYVLRPFIAIYCQYINQYSFPKTLHAISLSQLCTTKCTLLPSFPESIYFDISENIEIMVLVWTVTEIGDTSQLPFEFNHQNFNLFIWSIFENFTFRAKFLKCNPIINLLSCRFKF